jgi:hypothetical protein
MISHKPSANWTVLTVGMAIVRQLLTYLFGGLQRTTVANSAWQWLVWCRTTLRGDASGSDGVMATRLAAGCGGQLRVTVAI